MFRMPPWQLKSEALTNEPYALQLRSLHCIAFRKASHLFVPTFEERRPAARGGDGGSVVANYLYGRS